MLKKLNKINEIAINNVNSDQFKKYGEIIEGYDFDALIKRMEDKTQIPESGNEYQASVDFLEQLEVKKAVEKGFYGELPIQIGYCNGKSSSLDGLEYHKSSEINIAVTDLILLLGKRQDIENNVYDSSQVEAFYLPRGTAVELYGTTLHFASCKVKKSGFKCVVILPKETNLSLKEEVENPNQEQQLLFARNKWLLVHQEAEGLVNQGAYPGIKGDNITINSIAE